MRAEILSDLSHAEVATCLKVFEKIADKLGGTPRAMQPVDKN